MIVETWSGIGTPTCCGLWRSAAWSTATGYWSRSPTGTGPACRAWTPLDIITWGAGVTWLFQVMPVCLPSWAGTSTPQSLGRPSRGGGEVDLGGFRDRVMRPAVAGRRWFVVVAGGRGRGWRVGRGRALAAEVRRRGLASFRAATVVPPCVHGADRADPSHGRRAPAGGAWRVPVCDGGRRQVSWDIGVTGHHVHAHRLPELPVRLGGRSTQWGFFWQDGSLTSRRWHLYALARGAGRRPCWPGLGDLRESLRGPNMVGSGNHQPRRRIALLAYAAVQVGLVLLAEPWGSKAAFRATAAGKAGSGG